MNGEESLDLIRRIEANRDFLLTVLSQNPGLLAQAEPRIRQLMVPLPPAPTFEPGEVTNLPDAL